MTASRKPTPDYASPRPTRRTVRRGPVWRWFGLVSAIVVGLLIVAGAGAGVAWTIFRKPPPAPAPVVVRSPSTRPGIPVVIAPPPYRVAPPGDPAWALIRAVSAFDVDAAKRSFGNEPDPNLADDLGRTPLHILAAHTEWGAGTEKRPTYNTLVTLLLSHGADPNAVDAAGDTVLCTALRHGAEDDLIRLLLSKADVNRKGANGQAPVHVAAEAGSPVATIDLLCGDKADPNATDSAGRTPLHILAMTDDVALAEAFVAHGADVNVRDAKGRTPLRIAILADREKMVKFLKEHGATE